MSLHGLRNARRTWHGQLSREGLPSLSLGEKDHLRGRARLRPRSWPARGQPLAHAAPSPLPHHPCPVTPAPARLAGIDRSAGLLCPAADPLRGARAGLERRGAARRPLRAATHAGQASLRARQPASGPSGRRPSVPRAGTGTEEGAEATRASGRQLQTVPREPHPAGPL